MSHQEHRASDSRPAKWAETSAPSDGPAVVPLSAARVRATEEAATAIARELNGPLTALISAAALVAWFLVLKALSQRHIGGQTGDVLGTLQQGGEIVVLLTTLCIHS